MNTVLLIAFAFLAMAALAFTSENICYTYSGGVRIDSRRQCER